MFLIATGVVAHELPDFIVLRESLLLAVVIQTVIELVLLFLPQQGAPKFLVIVVMSLSVVVLDFPWLVELESDLLLFKLGEILDAMETLD